MRGWNTKRKNREKSEYFPPKKNPKFSIALIFPDNYSVGMANLGFQTVYGLLNSHEDVIVHRFFINDKGEFLSEEEEGVTLDRFDILLFSISFDTGYINLVRALIYSKISTYSKDRHSLEPFVFAGGIATLINPEPVAPFVDGFFLGDFEGFYLDFLREIRVIKEPKLSRMEKLVHLSKIFPNFYAPLLYNPIYDFKGILKGYENSLNLPVSIKPSKVKELEIAPYSRIVSSDSAFPDMFLVEVVRGCGMGCRFCSAGFVYRPSRMWSEKAIENAIEKISYFETDRIGIIGLEYLKNDTLSVICKKLLIQNLKLFFSSLRIDRLSDEFIEIYIKSSNNTITLAPEAGSEVLRKRINKNLSENEIFLGIEKVIASGIKNIKLYFMMGLPYETDEDIREIVYLVEKIRDKFLENAKKRGSIGTIKISISPFVPKPWTPFQFYRGDDAKILEKKINFLRDKLNAIPNVHFTPQSIRDYHLQMLISRGSRNCAIFIEKIANNHSLKSNIKDFYREYKNDYDPENYFEFAPWEIVGNNLNKNYLISEWNRAKKAIETKPCDMQKCKRCGGCCEFKD